MILLLSSFLDNNITWLSVCSSVILKSVLFSIFLAVTFVISSLYISAFYITPTFFLTIIFYLFMQVLYSFFLKSIAVADILVIATGYILRVYAGEFATGFHISVWLLLTVISLSLFLAVGKRRSELTLVSRIKNASIASVRKSLSHYSERYSLKKNLLMLIELNMS